MKGDGLVQGTNLGHTKIIAKAVGIHPATGQRVLYSQVSLFPEVYVDMVIIIIIIF